LLNQLPPNNFEIFNAGFSNNIYGEQSYCFNFNEDFDISNYFDEFNFPITDLYLYCIYIPSDNETISNTNWNNENIGIDGTLSIGDLIYGDLIEYSMLDFAQTQISGQTYYITTSYSSGLKRLKWKYNPFIPFKLRYLSNELYKANINTTSYDSALSIPEYATLIDDNGNYIWRTILSQGYIDPLTGIGVDYPFINKRRYLFSSIILDVTPDLNDPETLSSFNDIWFTKDSIIVNTLPISDTITNDDVTPPSALDNIGKPCQ